MSRISTDATRTFHVKIGIRNIVMPGARRQMIVVTKLTAPRMVPIPPMPTPRIHRSAPTLGEWILSASGMYIVQPNDAAPPGVRKPDSMIVPPAANSQKPSALRRGNATSGAPICSGMM